MASLSNVTSLLIFFLFLLDYIQQSSVTVMFNSLDKT